MKNVLLIVLALVFLGVGACKEKESPVPTRDAGRSPNVTLPPSPRSSLATNPRDDDIDAPIGMPADSKGRLIVRDAQRSEPTPLKPASALEPDRVLHRESQGLTLTAEWTWNRVPAPLASPETNLPGIKEAKNATRHLWQVEVLETGRIRVVFDSPSFPLTKFTELRSRHDIYGHILVWPDAESYRVVPVGALRALLDERRIDVSPLVLGTIGKEQTNQPKFGFPTRKTKISTPWGDLELTQARTTNVGAGGSLLCRMLMEIAGANPNSTVCEDGKVPVHAVFSWKDGGQIVFDVTTLLIRNDFQSSQFLVPPPRASFSDKGLPPTAAGIFLTREQMDSFRTKGLALPEPRMDPEAAGAPGEGILALNHTDALRFLLVDGVPVAWVPARGQQYLIGSKAGKYSIQWRSFLGMGIEDPKEVLFPAKITVGSEPEEEAGQEE